MINEEIKNVLKADNRRQYKYFIKKVADFEEIWSLRNADGWVTSGMGDEMFFPIWPKKEFADICRVEAWQDCYAESIDLDEFLDDWIDGLKEDNIRLTVMWYNGKGIDIDWDRLRDDIEYELENY